MRKSVLLFLLFSLCYSVSAGEHWRKPSEKTIISQQGKGKLKIVINGSELRSQAERLSQLLKEISGATFEIVSGDGKTGIALGTPESFPSIPFHPVFNMSDLGERQGYEIKSHPQGIYLIGATPQGVTYAVSELLEQLGYRYFFAPEEWEIIPENPDLSFSGYIRETPDFYHRWIWPTFGYWPEYKNNDSWDAMNRNIGYMLNTRHMYAKFVQDNKSVFDAHPEYYALYEGKRTSDKLCISNPGLQQTFVNYVVKQFEKNPKLESFSADPSDRRGWCECDVCAKMGTPSTRAVFLANQAAEAVSKRFKNKRIGMYAYNFHSAPPEIDVHPDVVVSVATEFIRWGQDLSDIIAGWQAKKAHVGIREYYSLGNWPPEIPGGSSGSRLEYLRTSIPDFYNKGARYLSAESGDEWGANGLGYYLAAKMMWNVKQADQLESLKQDFLTKCFGAAAPDMKVFYNLVDGSKRRPLSTDLVGRMYRALDQALKNKTLDSKMIKRINNLVLYTRECELMLLFENGKTADKYMDLINHSIAIKKTRMVHTHGIYKEPRYAPSTIRSQLPPFDWKNIDPPYGEIPSILKNGIAQNPLLDFETVEFSNKLIPVKIPGESKPGTIGNIRDYRKFYVWSEGEPSGIPIKVTGGLLNAYRDRGNVNISLYQIGGASDEGMVETLVQSDISLPPDGNEHTAILRPKYKGLHLVTINDGNNQTQVDWPEKAWMMMPVQNENEGETRGDFFFYVPKNTKVIGFYANTTTGSIIDPNGKKTIDLTKVMGYFSVPVPQGMDGKVWSLSKFRGTIRLLTVPPYLSLYSGRFLLPEELVLKDQLK